MFLLTLEFVADVVLSCDPHTLLLTLQTSSAPILMCITFLLCCKTTRQVQPFFSFLFQKCSSVSFVLFREAETSGAGACTVLTKVSSSFVLHTCGDKKVSILLPQLRCSLLWRCDLSFKLSHLSPFFLVSFFCQQFHHLICKVLFEEYLVPVGAEDYDSTDRPVCSKLTGLQQVLKSA